MGSGDHFREGLVHQQVVFPAGLQQFALESTEYWGGLIVHHLLLPLALSSVRVCFSEKVFFFCEWNGDHFFLTICARTEVRVLNDEFVVLTDSEFGVPNESFLVILINRVVLKLGRKDHPPWTGGIDIVNNFRKAIAIYCHPLFFTALLRKIG